MPKKTKKEGTRRVPKQIAGIKLPKPLRKSAEALIAEVEKPETRAMLASGATVLVGAVMAAQAKRSAAPAAPAAPGEPATPPTPSETDKIVDAVSSMARQAMQQMFAKK
jgi:Ni,Fe-hydrogenase III small subunit